jgi:hypothetical protein
MKPVPSNIRLCKLYRVEEVFLAESQRVTRTSKIPIELNRRKVCMKRSFMILSVSMYLHYSRSFDVCEAFQGSYFAVRIN